MKPKTAYSAEDAEIEELNSLWLAKVLDKALLLQAGSVYTLCLKN